MREQLRQLSDKVYAYTPSGGTPEYLVTLQQYYRGIGDRARPRPDHRHHGRQRGDPLRDDGLRERRRRGAGGRAVLHELHRLRDHGRRAPGAADQPRRGRLPPAAARGVGEGAHPEARSMVVLCNPNNPTGTVYTPEELADGGCVLQGPRPLPGLGRGLPRVRLRRPHVEERAHPLRDGRERDRGGQPVQALQRVRRPAGLPRDAERGGAPGGDEDGAGTPLRARPGPGRRGRRARARPRVHAGHRGRVPEAAATSSSRACPRSRACSCASRRARSTSWPASPCATARTSRAWLLTDFQKNGGDGDGRARAGASTPRRASAPTRCASPTS